MCMCVYERERERERERKRNASTKICFVYMWKQELHKKRKVGEDHCEGKGTAELQRRKI